MDKILRKATDPRLFVLSFLMNLQLFDNTQTTGKADLSVEMKTYYSDYLIDMAEPELIHDQFAQKQPIPQGSGKTVEFRKYAPLAKALTPLTEGVTPTGNSLKVTAITATISQYGDYIELSDLLKLTAIDNNITMATKLLGQQAGRTLDTITREVMNGGTNVQYGNGQVAARYLLVGGDATPANNHYYGVDTARRSSRGLKINNTPKIKGNFIAIIHPDVTYDVTGDLAWVDAAMYAGSTPIYEGEIGKLHKIRYVETTEAKVFHAANMTLAARNLTVTAYAAKVMTVAEAITAPEATALAGRKVIVAGFKYTVASSAAGAAGAATVTIVETPTVAPVATNIVYPGEGGAKGRDVYSTLTLGDNAYGTTEVTGGGLETIVHNKGTGGPSDALDQRSTVGWKATKTAERLVEEYMIRVETCSTFEIGAN